MSWMVSWDIHTVYSYTMLCNIILKSIVRRICLDVRCMLYKVQYTIYTVWCIVYVCRVQCTTYAVRVPCTTYTLWRTMCNVHCTLYIVQCTLYSVQCSGLKYPMCTSILFEFLYRQHHIIYRYYPLHHIRTYYVLHHFNH